VLTRKRQRLTERNDAVQNIKKREYHNESTEESLTVLAHDRHLSGLRLVDLSHDLEAVDLILTSEGPISELVQRKME